MQWIDVVPFEISCSSWRLTPYIVKWQIFHNQINKRINENEYIGEFRYCKIEANSRLVWHKPTWSIWCHFLSICDHEMIQYYRDGTDEKDCNDKTFLTGVRVLMRHGFSFHLTTEPLPVSAVFIFVTHRLKHVRFVAESRCKNRMDLCYALF